MPRRKRTKKFERLVVNAIKRLQELQGSTPKEISDYLSQEYSVPNKKIQTQVRLALRRGVSYGILEQKSRNTYACNKEFLERGNKANFGEVIDTCPWFKHCFGRTKKWNKAISKKPLLGRGKTKRYSEKIIKKSPSPSHSGGGSGRIRKSHRRKGGKNHARKKSGKKNNYDHLTLINSSSGRYSRKKPIKARRKQHSKRKRKSRSR